MPSIKILAPPITEADIADGAVTTSKIADGAVTPEKCADGVLIGTIAFDHTAKSYTLDAGAESTIVNITGVGAVTVLYAGDGDSNISVRVYVDGSLDDEIPCNESRVGIYSFTGSVTINAYNPGTVTVTATVTTFYVRGVYR